jgi:hypothetical protein
MGGNPGRRLLLCPSFWFTPWLDRPLRTMSTEGSSTGKSCAGAEAEGWGASGRFWGEPGCCPMSICRLIRSVPTSRTLLKSLLTSAPMRKTVCHYSRRSFCIIGNLRMMLGRNSNTRLPPISEAMEVPKVRPTTLPVLLGEG